MKKIKNIVKAISPVEWLIIISVLIIFWMCIYSATNYKEVIITVKDKIVKNYEDDSLYLIFTDKGTYEVRDSIVNGRFNSSDMYGRLEKGHTYKVTVIGFRVPLLSWYKNILSAEEIEGQ